MQPSNDLSVEGIDQLFWPSWAGSVRHFTRRLRGRERGIPTFSAQKTSPRKSNKQHFLLRVLRTADNKLEKRKAAGWTLTSLQTCRCEPRSPGCVQHVSKRCQDIQWMVKLKLFRPSVLDLFVHSNPNRLWIKVDMTKGKTDAPKLLNPIETILRAVKTMSRPVLLICLQTSRKPSLANRVLEGQLWS